MSKARSELENVVRQLESGTSNLESSIALWERGEALASRCEAWLEGAENACTRCVTLKIQRMKKLNLRVPSPKTKA